MKRTVILTVSLLALAALAVAAPAVQAKGGPGMRIALKSSGAFPGASGKAKFQNEGQRELEIEVEHVRRLAGRRVNFFVNSTKVGSARGQRARRGAGQPPRRRLPGDQRGHTDQGQDRGRQADRLGPVLEQTSP
jgi:opacity protein-like surface antigen